MIDLANEAKTAQIDKAIADAEQKQAKLDAKRDDFGGFAQRGTAEAFSAILKATRSNSELSAIGRLRQGG